MVCDEPTGLDVLTVSPMLASFGRLLVARLGNVSLSRRYFGHRACPLWVQTFTIEPRSDGGNPN